MRDGPALRPDHPGPRGQITRGGGHHRAGQGDLRETGEEAPVGFSRLRWEIASRALNAAEAVPGAGEVVQVLLIEFGKVKD